MAVIRYCTAPLAEAKASDCIAHRCEEHKAAGLMNHKPDEEPIPECGPCVAAAAIAAVMTEIVLPILLAYENAAGALILSGATKDPKIGALTDILEAAVNMKNEGEFKPQFHQQDGINEPVPPGKVN